MYRNRIAQLAVAAGLLSVAACKDNWPTTPLGASSASAGRSITPTWEKTVTGTTGEGAQYSVFVPVNWNGDVVYYAHGIKDVAEPIALPVTTGFPEFRDSLGVMGYAVATSSFSENGWAVQDGMQKTHQLRGIFASIAGNPRRSFIAGHSMGGLITVALAEKFPQQYDGALAMCGVMGGAQKQIDYIANVRTVFDFFYPNVLPGNALDMPAELDLNTQVLGPAQAAILSNLSGAGAIARVAQTPVPFANGPELVQSILTALAFDARGADDLMDRTHGHSPFFNDSASYYTGALDAGTLAALNAGARHFDETPDAANYLAKYYETTGDLRIPMVSIHTTRDPVVPIFHEGIYASRANGAGQSVNLFQRQVDQYGHCAFTGHDMARAFRDLATWVATGSRPTP
jgi:pimeloyl-ACP methyl ester carboxylesterase